MVPSKEQFIQGEFEWFIAHHRRMWRWMTGDAGACKALYLEEGIE